MINDCKVYIVIVFFVQNVTMYLFKKSGIVKSNSDCFISLFNRKYKKSILAYKQKFTMRSYLMMYPRLSIKYLLQHQLFDINLWVELKLNIIIQFIITI